jgi:cell shape-determining protein MreC
MVPFMLSAEEEEDPATCTQYSNCYFVAENPAMLFSSAEDQASNCAEAEMEMEESEESIEESNEESDEHTDAESEDST